MRCRLLLLVGLYALLLPCALGTEMLQARVGRQLAEVSRTWPTRPDQDVLAVGLLDGRVVAVDSSSGKVLWTFDSGAPLLSVQQAEGSPAGTHIFPGVDGALYAYHGIAGDKAKLERLPITLPELVDASPSMTDDGSLIVGKRQSSVFMLDTLSGQPLRVMSGNLDDRATAAMQLQLVDPGHAILMGREDYTVRSMHVGSGVEAWNATFSRFMRLGPSQAATAAAAGVAAGLGAGTAPGAALPPTPHFTVSADNSLQAYDAEGYRMWSIAFDAPPIAAFSSFNQGLNHLDPAAIRAARNAAAMPNAAVSAPVLPPPDQSLLSRSAASAGSSALSKLPGQLQPGTGGSSLSTRVLVGAINGNPYVLPADHLLVEQPPALSAQTGGAGAWDTAVAIPGSGGGVVPVGVGGGGVGEVGVCSPGAVSGGGQKALAALPGQQVVSFISEDGGDAGLTGQLVCPPGMHIVAHTSDAVASLPWLPNSSGRSGRDGPASPPALAPAPAPSPYSVQQLPWFIQLAGLLLVMVALVALGWVASRVQAGMRVSGQLLPAQDAALALPLTPLPLVAAASDSSSSSAVPEAPVSPQSPLRTAGPVAVALAASAPGPTSSPLGRGKKRGKKGKGAGSSGVASGAASDADPGSNHSGYGISSSSTPPASEQPAASNLVATATATVQAAAGDRRSMPNGKQNGKAASNVVPLPVGGMDSSGAIHSQGSDGTSGDGVTKGKSPPPQGASGAADGAQAQPQAQAQPAAGAGTMLQATTSTGSIGGAAGSGVGPINGRYARLQPDGSLVIGRLRVGPAILGYGSAGTIVYEGTMDGRAVAVKRLLRQFYDLAKKEIEVLIMSDEHPNVVRCFAMEEDREFVYLALEKCRSTLNDLMGSPTGRAAMLDACVTTSGAPSPSGRCLELMHQVAQGLAALHERSIVHRDLKPHNVLITDAGRAKLSDMGLSKQLVAEQSSFESHGAGGSSGWQAPEQLIARGGGSVRQTRAMDVFSLGCVLHYCLTGGMHPFGDSYARDGNILHQPPNLSALSAQPEAANLLAAMLHKDPGARPSMAAVLSHPLWWNAEQRLNFLVATSDRVESEDREPDQTLLAALEAHARSAFGGNNWGTRVDPELVANLGRFRRYDFTSLRDLLRVVRNKRNHFQEMPPELRSLLGEPSEKFFYYFSTRFPGLLMAVYAFGLRYMQHEPTLQRYWSCGATACDPFLAAAPRPSKPALPKLPSAAAVTAAAGTLAVTVPAEELAKATAAAQGAGSTPKGEEEVQLPSVTGRSASTPVVKSALAANVSSAASATTSDAPPPSPAPAPAPSAAAAADSQTPSGVIVGYEVCSDSGATTIVEFPSRPGKQLCDFYVKTGHCKYGETCVYDHPSQHSVPRTSLGLPLRPGQQVCPFYLKHNECKYGAACKYHHPLLKPMYAGSARTGSM